MCVWVGAVVMAHGALLASRQLHAGLLDNCLRSPTSFYDVTPLGRILNRFSKDVDVVDATIPQTMSMWLRCTLQVTSMIVVIGYSTPYFILVAAAMGVFYFIVQVRLMATQPSLRPPPFARLISACFVSANIQ